MPDLIAQGPQPQYRWRRTLPADHRFVVGRAIGVWAAPWDEQISRQHVEIRWHQGRLEVTRLPDSRNPLFFRGHSVRQCRLKPGEHFVIGQTTFTLVEEGVTISVDAPHPASEQQYSALYLRKLRFRDADQRIDVLSRLPELISGATDDVELSVRLVSVVLSCIPSAAAAAIVAARPGTGGEACVDVLHWDRRCLTGDNFRPSQRTICQALELGQSVVHQWHASPPGQVPVTYREDVDWAFCTPFPGHACRGWAIYVEGQQADDPMAPPGDSVELDLRDELKFVELAATTVSNLREVRLLQHRQSSLGQFFSPRVLEALANQDPDTVLAPREAMVTVLFCDLRGFARRSEQYRDDLLGLLHRVSQTLGVMTRHILEQGGVVGDFHGDSALGFWGWPLAQPVADERACRAALAIRADMESAAGRSDDPLADFRVGIGIASGKAVAGKIGSVDQVKVTVFGPVVNLAARLEGMTKIIHAPILLDSATAQALRDHVPSDEARLRRVAVVRPYGLETALEVSELLPPMSEYPLLSDEHLRMYEAAVAALLAGDWSRSFDLLDQVPADDRVKDFLTVFIAQHNRTAPAGWDGVIPMASK